VSARTAADGPAIGAGGLALIVNPAATKVRPDTPARVRAGLAALGPVTPVVATSAADTVVEAQRAVAAGARVVAVVGGDGTVNAVAAVVAGTDAMLLPLPGGSTNVFARGVGWPADLGRSLDEVPRALHAAPRVLRLGEVELDGRPGRTVCVNVGVGLDAAAVAWVEAHPRFKHALRQVAFAAAVAGPGLRALVRRAPLWISVDGAPPVRAVTLMVGCGRPYAYVGPRPLNLMPRADWDGTLEWLSLARPSPPAAAAALLGGLRGGRHLAAPALMGGTTRGEVRVRGVRPAPVQADGEALGPAHEVVVRPGPVLRVVVPASGAGAGP